MREKILKIYPVVLIIIAGLLSISWFKGNFLVNPGDTNFSFNPPNDLYRCLFMWDHQQGLGWPDSVASAKAFPYNLLLFLLNRLGLALSLSQKILFYLIFTLSGITAYFLIKYLSASEAYNRPAALLGANFYMMNTYLIQLRWGSGYLMGMFFYAILPFLVLMWFKGRITKDTKYGIYIALGCLLALPSLNNPAYSVPILVIYGLDFVLQLFINFRNKVELISLFRYVFTTFLIFILILAFWMVSILIPFQERIEGLMKSTTQFRQEVVTASMSSILNLFRNLGDWGFWSDYAGDLYYPYSPIYKLSLFIIIGFMIIIYAVIPLFLLRKQNSTVRYVLIFFSLIFLIGIWLSKGTHSPLGNIYQFAVSKISLFSVLRAAYEKFGTLIVISIAVLLAFSLVRVIHYIKTKIRQMAIILLYFSLVNMYAFPFWTGDIWRSEGKVLAGFRFQIPAYYYDLQKYLDALDEQTYRILNLPDNATSIPGIITLNLEGRSYSGSDPLSRIIKVPIVYINPFNFSISENLTSSFYQYYSKNLVDFMGKIGSLSKILNTKFILLRGDSNNKLYPRIRDANEIKPFLNYFKLERSFGELYLYKIADKYFLPHIYHSFNSLVIPGGADMLITLPEGNYLKGKPVLLFTKDNKSISPDINKFTYRDSILPGSVEEAQLTFKRINPTKYLVKITDAKLPFWLVFNEGFSNNWKLYAFKQKNKDRRPLFDIIESYPDLNIKEAKPSGEFNAEDIKWLWKKPLNIKNYIVNGYANGWYIEPKKLGLGNEVILIIYFLPQSIFYLGLSVSILALFGCLVYLIKDYYQSRIKYVKQ